MSVIVVLDLREPWRRIMDTFHGVSLVDRELADAIRDVFGSLRDPRLDAIRDRMREEIDKLVAIFREESASRIESNRAAVTRWPWPRPVVRRYSPPPHRLAWCVALRAFS